ncbi:MAG: SagB/ThcOx family dehydrogenase [Planctomycetota bacterium]|jgi:SagB-type dehydrogenase family enzyme
MREILMTVLSLGTMVAMSAQAGSTRQPGPSNRDVRLPKPAEDSAMSVTEALARRRSHREFKDDALSPEQVSQLCWAALGVTKPSEDFRTAPSAGGLNGMSLFVVDRAGVFEYLPRPHALRRLSGDDIRKNLQAAALDQSCVGDAPLCLVIAMNVAHVARKYGDRAERYCLIEAGHIAQNVLLQATAMGLGGVPVGAFEDEDLTALLSLRPALQPVYLVPLGYPAAGR